MPWLVRTGLLALVAALPCLYAGDAHAGAPAARIGDMHSCPMMTVLVPHVGGPVLPPGSSDVRICGLPAARAGDLATCVGAPDTLANGSPTVLINGKPAISIASRTAHGGVVVTGCPSVLIGP